MNSWKGNFCKEMNQFFKVCFAFHSKMVLF